MSYDRWHPLDGNMIAADEHHNRKKPKSCPVCNFELEEDDDGPFCPECGWGPNDEYDDIDDHAFACLND